MQPITTEELKASLDANHDLKLLMVVGPWEFRARHIPGSVGYPSPRTALLELGRDDQIILYANNHYRGNTSAAAAALAAHGYRNVRIYRGGLVDWQAAGYPVEGNNVATGSRPRRPFGRRRRRRDLQGGCRHCDNGWSGYGWPPPRRPLLSPPAISNPPIPGQLPSPRRSGAAPPHGGLAQPTASSQLSLGPPWRVVRRRRASPVGSDPGRPPRPLGVGRPLPQDGLEVVVPMTDAAGPQAPAPSASGIRASSVVRRLRHCA
jgi:rhodanese-related sulfurtransferase